MAMSSNSFISSQQKAVFSSGQIKLIIIITITAKFH